MHESHDQDVDNENNKKDQPSYEELSQKVQQYWDRIIRMQADAENAARRSGLDVANAHKYALEKFVNELLPIVDSLELCINNAPQNEQDPVVEGVRLTLKMFYAALEKFGVMQVNPQGEVFDPEFQQAISVQADDTVPPNTVVSVLQKGYTLNNRLVRPALVIVSKKED